MTIRSLEEVSGFEQLCLIDMSYSRISSYKLCPSKYFYTYIQKEPWSFSAPAALGNIVHDVLEEQVGEEELNFANCVLAFEQYRPVHDPDYLITDDLIEAAHVMMAEFCDKHTGDFTYEEDVDTGLQVVAKEQQFKIVIGSALVTGYIDMVCQLNDDELYIIDWKTGKFEETAKSISTNLQLSIYVLAIAHLFPEVNKFKAELYYLRSGRRKSHTFTREDLEGLEATAIEQIDAIVNDFHFHPTTNSRICGFCEHASSGACKWGVNARRRLTRR